MKQLKWPELAPEAHTSPENMLKWIAGCFKEFRFQTSPPTITSSVHSSPVLHASSSNSGNYVVTTSHDTVVLWDVSSEIRIEKIIKFQCVRCNDGLLRYGVRYSQFNETDEYLLVSGGCSGQFQLPGDDEYGGALYGAAVYRSDCTLLRVITIGEYQSFRWCKCTVGRLYMPL